MMTMPHEFRVGSLYHPARTSWPECAQYAYRGGGHELVLFLGAPSNAERDSVRIGLAEFALFVEPPVIVIVYRFAPALPWSDAPFSWHLVPEDERVLPPPVDDAPPAERGMLAVTLVDATTGLVRALRMLTWSPEFTRAVHRAIVAQSIAPAEGYDLALAAVYARHATTIDLLAACAVRCASQPVVSVTGGRWA